MTDDPHSFDEPDDVDLAALTALLARADPWDEPPRELEDAVVAAIRAEATAAATVASRNTPGTELTASPAGRRAHARWSATRVLGAVAAVVVIVVGVAVLTRDGSDGVTFALAGTEAEPDASAEVTMWATPAGLKILLDADGLPGAPEGYMYEAWVGDGTIGVSAGTFHLRGAHGTIELWAGVTGPGFDRIWITMEPIDDDASSSSDARLRGEFSLADD